MTFCDATGKQCHPTKANAGHQASRLRQIERRRGTINAYKCSHCGHWHAGHIPTSRKRRS